MATIMMWDGLPRLTLFASTKPKTLKTWTEILRLVSFALEIMNFYQECRVRKHFLILSMRFDHWRSCQNSAPGLIRRRVWASWLRRSFGGVEELNTAVELATHHDESLPDKYPYYYSIIRHRLAISLYEMHLRESRSQHLEQAIKLERKSLDLIGHHLFCLHEGASRSHALPCL